MKKTAEIVLLFICLCILLSGCGIGNKSVSTSMVYAAATALSLMTAIGYLLLIRKKDPWFLLLFSSVFIVNTGYLALSLSQTLNAALWFNRLSYLGSVFLPLSMLMIILDTCKLQYPKYLPNLLLGAGAIIFLIAATPGYSDIYYREVSLLSVNGMTVLEKVYGPLHCVYLFYLLAYFLAAAAVLFHACVNRQVDSAIHAVFMSAALFVNIGVWLLEQLVRIDFELLSVSYIVSELFLLLLCLMLQNAAHSHGESSELPREAAAQNAAEAVALPIACEPADEPSQEQCAYFAERRAALTPAERTIYELYLSGKTTKEVLAELGIKENTLKYHNKNIYGKLGVSSRKELLRIAAQLSESESVGE